MAKNSKRILVEVHKEWCKTVKLPFKQDAKDDEYINRRINETKK